MCFLRKPLSVTLVCILMILAAVAGLEAAPPPVDASPPNYRQLQPIQVFGDKLLGTWSCNMPDCDLNASDNLVPIDDSPEGMYGELPSLKLEIRESQSGWWMVILSGPNWVSRSLVNYAPNGFLEFNVKGSAGGEDFLIKLTDIVPGRDPAEHNVQVNLSSYITVTTEWQSVAIPLADFNFAADPEYRLTQVRDVRFEEAYAGPYAKTVWINNIRFTSPDIEPGFPALKVNQLGYLPDAEKYALVTGFAEDLPANLGPGTPFALMNAADDAMVFTGELELITEYDPFVSGERILRADFSDFNTPGTYYLSLPESDEWPGGNQSLTFTIGGDIYDHLLVDAARYFYYQRQGVELTPEYAGDFARPLGHPQDAAAPLHSALNAGEAAPETFDVSQGWYDAGDYGKYVAYAGPAIDDLLAAYELYPDAFTDSQFRIPESGNDVPDLLDELRWELDWMLKMQDSADGGFYERVYTDNTAMMPDQDTEPRYIEDLLNGTTPRTKPTRATAIAVANLAHAARVYREVDAEYADRLLEAARGGWGYLQAHSECWPPTWWTCDKDSMWNDEAENRLWAAAELFHTTGEAEFGDYFLAHYSEPPFSEMWLSTTGNAGEPGMRAFLAYMESPQADPEAMAWFAKHFSTWRDGQLARTENSAWRTFLNDGSDGNDSDFYWGSNAATLETIVVLARGNAILGGDNAPITRAAIAQLNYILGINPLRHSYVSGYGEDSVSTLYSNIYSYDGKPGLPAGYMVEGPNQFDGGQNYSRFYGKCYIDNNSDWTTSEHAIYYNASLTFVATLATAAQGVLPAPALDRHLDLTIFWDKPVQPPQSTYTITLGMNDAEAAYADWVLGNITGEIAAGRLNRGESNTVEREVDWSVHPAIHWNELFYVFGQGDDGSTFAKIVTVEFDNSSSMILPTATASCGYASFDITTGTELNLAFPDSAFKMEIANRGIFQCGTLDWQLIGNPLQPGVLSCSPASGVLEGSQQPGNPTMAEIECSLDWNQIGPGQVRDYFLVLYSVPRINGTASAHLIQIHTAKNETSAH